MTKKVFWEDPYLSQLQTQVKTVSGNQITLNETIFYAFSGGQESDAGTIAGIKVLGARKEGKELFYTMAAGHQFQVGEVVDIIIDSERRYQLMRLHFAAEIVLELVYQQFKKAVKIGAHIAQDKSRIDFQWDQNCSTLMQPLQEAAQAIIDSNQDIISTFSDEAAERRYWKINEFSPVSCGGTHLKNTREVGRIRLKRVNPGKGKERIEIYVS